MAKAKKPTPQEIYWARKRKEEQEKVALLPAGLINHGNTCFMNSVLQGLSATPLLEQIARFRVPETLRPLASRRSPLITNGRGPEDVEHDWVRGMNIGDVFSNIMDRAWRMRDARERSSMSPRELLSRLGQKYDQYLDFRQQDAHEFLIHLQLLDGMRMEELDIIKQRQPPPPKSSKARGNSGNRRAIPEAIPEEDRLTPFVDMVFGGKLASVLICETCKHVSHTQEDFDDLSLSITHDESRERKRDRLRAIASRFIVSNRSRDVGQPRPQSLSQPPSPSLPSNTLEPTEDPPESPRRRSLEASSPSGPVSDQHNIDILAGFRNAANEDTIGEVPMQLPKARSRKGSDAGLGRLGRRISVGMALSSRKEKKVKKVEKDTKSGAPESTKLNGKGNEVDDSRTSVAVSAASSKASSRQPSPGPPKKPLKEKAKPRKLSEHELQTAAYLRRLLEDATPGPLNPLAVLRMAGSQSPMLGSGWAKLGATQGVEDCLRIFTSVEVLDGDNMFGCRNCWKIANGRVPTHGKAQSDGDSDTSSDEDERQEREDTPIRPETAGPMQSFSMPNLSPRGIPDSPTLPPSIISSSVHPASDSALSEATELTSSGLGLNLGPSASTSITSFASTPQRHTNGVGSPNVMSQGDSESAQPTAREPGRRALPIPTIIPVSPPPEGDSLVTPTAHAPQKTSQPFDHFSGQSNGQEESLRDSLRLPDRRSRHRREIARDGESSLSSEESEYDSTSGISDGDGSLVSTPSSAAPSRTRPSRPKQVIYRRALKRYLIARPPPILVIHLKRFQQVSKSPVTLFGNLKKLDEYVSFPEYLDIRPFLAPKKEDYGLGKGELRGKVAEKGKREEDRPCVYRLYAVVVHIGNMLGGHYISYTALPHSRRSVAEPENGTDSMGRETHVASVKGGPAEPSTTQERQWCYISDTVVRLVSLEEVLKAKAYLCMYERVP